MRGRTLVTCLLAVLSVGLCLNVTAQEGNVSLQRRGIIEVLRSLFGLGTYDADDYDDGYDYDVDEDGTVSGTIYPGVTSDPKWNLSSSNDSVVAVNDFATKQEVNAQVNVQGDNRTPLGESVTLLGEFRSSDTKKENGTAFSDKSSDGAGNSSGNKTNEKEPNEDSSDNDTTFSQGLMTSDPMCLVEPTLQSNCHIPSRYIDDINEFTTIDDLIDIIADYDVRAYLEYFCKPGKWCLGNTEDYSLSDTIYFPKGLCNVTILDCIGMLAKKYSKCAKYKKYTTIHSSIDLVCKYLKVDSDLSNWNPCGLKMMKMVYVTFSDLNRDIPVSGPRLLDDGNYLEPPVQNFCESRQGMMVSSYQCLNDKCSNLADRNIITEFEPWKWFTENTTASTQCPIDSDCAELTTLPDVPTQEGVDDFYEINDLFGTQTSSIGEIVDFADYNRKDTKHPNKEEDVKINEELHEDNAMKTTWFKSHVAMNANIVAGLSILMVVVIIAMSIMVVAVWRKMKNPNNINQLGYAKLKTGEC